MSGPADPAAVRRALPSDLPGLLSLWVAITEHHAGVDPLFELRPGAEPLIRDLLESQLRDPDTAVFVHDDGSALTGLCIVRVDRAPAILVETERAEITDLGVRTSQRRQGIGRALTEAATAWARARGVERLEVRVASGNRVGQAFWRALDFGDLMDVLQRRL